MVLIQMDVIVSMQLAALFAFHGALRMGWKAV